MARPKFFRDPVHVQLRFDSVPLSNRIPKEGFPRRSWLLRTLIETEAFQRLRFIRQNGLTNLVFHGAEHSRFTHSLGVCDLAGRNYECIRRNCSEVVDEDELLLVTAAALLHDIGHGPFSHTLEEVVNEVGGDFKHEKMTLKFINSPDSDVHRILSDVDGGLPDRLTPFFDAEARAAAPHWMYKIVSSQMDADRLDYLMRDSLFCGIKGHGFDLARIQDLMYHHDKRLAVEIGAIEAVEAYLVTLDHLWRAVYYHHTVRAASVMLTKLFARAVKLHRDGDKGIFPDLGNGSTVRSFFDNLGNVDTKTYSRFAEFQMWQCLDIWREAKDFVLRDLSRRLLTRSLFKSIEISDQSYPRTTQLIERAEGAARKLFGELDDTSVKSYVIFDEPYRTSYKTYTWTPESAEDSIWLIGEGINPHPIEDDRSSGIIQGLKNQKTFPRLIIPAEVKEALLL